MILIECTSQVVLLRLRAQSNSMQDECHGPGEDGEPVEATKRRADIAGNIDQLHVTKSSLVCPLKPFRSHCNISDSPAREPNVQQRLIDRRMRPAAAHVLDHA